MTNALGGMAHMMDLNTLIPTNSGWEMMEASSINTSGQIVGWAEFTRSILSSRDVALMERQNEPDFTGYRGW
jgi:hypothetical protein